MVVVVVVVAVEMVVVVSLCKSGLKEYGLPRRGEKGGGDSTDPSGCEEWHLLCRGSFGTRRLQNPSAVKAKRERAQDWYWAPRMSGLRQGRK